MQGSWGRTPRPFCFACYVCYVSMMRWSQIPPPSIVEVFFCITAQDMIAADPDEFWLDAVWPQARGEPPVVERFSLDIRPRRLIETMKRL